MLCKKDTYELLAESIGIQMNAGICELFLEDRKTPKQFNIFCDGGVNDDDFVCTFGDDDNGNGKI